MTGAKTATERARVPFIHNILGTIMSRIRFGSLSGHSVRWWSELMPLEKRNQCEQRARDHTEEIEVHTG
jgi:hypothetical protein